MRQPELDKLIDDNLSDLASDGGMQVLIAENIIDQMTSYSLSSEQWESNLKHINKRVCEFVKHKVIILPKDA